MNQHEVIDVLKVCLPIYSNLHDKIKHSLTAEEIKWLNKFKLIWDKQLYFEDGIIEKAGMDIYKFAFLGGCLMQLEIKKQRSEISV